MRPIQELLEQDEYISYHSLLESCDVEVMDTLTLGSYQGDYLMIVRQGDRYGLLTVGYGSCGGCDALEGALDDAEFNSRRWADNDDEGDAPRGDNGQSLDSLRNSMYNSIIWRSPSELALYLKDKDWQTEFYYHLDGDDDHQELAEFANRHIENLLVIDISHI